LHLINSGPIHPRINSRKVSSIVTLCRTIELPHSKEVFNEHLTAYTLLPPRSPDLNSYTCYFQRTVKELCEQSLLFAITEIFEEKLLVF
jgi:hypothetical protein